MKTKIQKLQITLIRIIPQGLTKLIYNQTTRALFMIASDKVEKYLDSPHAISAFPQIDSDLAKEWEIAQKVISRLGFADKSPSVTNGEALICFQRLASTAFHLRPKGLRGKYALALIRIFAEIVQVEVNLARLTTAGDIGSDRAVKIYEPLQEEIGGDPNLISLAQALQVREILEQYFGKNEEIQSLRHQFAEISETLRFTLAKLTEYSVSSPNAGRNHHVTFSTKRLYQISRPSHGRANRLVHRRRSSR